MMRGWGQSASWTTLVEAIAAAERSQAKTRRLNDMAQYAHDIAISRSAGRKGGYRHGTGDIVATVHVDGTIKYGRS